MSRSTNFLSLVFLGGLAVTFAFAPAVTTASAQDQPGTRRGMGFGGGGGPGHGRGMGGPQGRGMMQRSAAEEHVDRQSEVTYPAIAGYGGVVRLPNADQQPRASTKLLVDLTSGGDADRLNPGLEKVAKYLNIYAGGGARPVDVKVAVVFHGEATLAVLNEDAYAAKFETNGNPNLNLLRQLDESGVDLYVCGQSLISKGSSTNDVAGFVKTAVSALTAVVNLQTDGFAYVPIAQASPAPSPQSQPSKAEKNRDLAQEGHGHGPGPGMGRGRMATQGHGSAPGMQSDMSTLHAMFADRHKIKRTVKMLPDGAVAVTESDDEMIAAMLKEHVPAMEDRVLGNKPLPPMTFHPVFVGLIQHADDYTLTHEETDKGVKVTYHSDNPYVIMLVQEHAKLVSRFIKNGMEEIHTPYELPEVSNKVDPNDR
ncbi:DsrE family protein [Neorhodopirellula pilleata]|uniref:DsrE/DsrF-like family protein n=1 Tax=Neorhodopirellula pilleata TaxID=2714738 RepID=A0A5C5ZQM6_9BACT|nr:DsrE family protein [Neorhodopirellula pilleata]TWT89368.1 DsrE/DsrF-like family protein [Neorhodopirellula pilleata]